MSRDDGIDWRRIPQVAQVAEAARVVGEAEIVLDFGGDARGWFRIAVFEDLKADGDEAFFARATERGDPKLQAVATGATAQEAAASCLREAGVSLRRARG